MSTAYAPPPRPVPFLEAAPLTSQDLRRGEIPRQFTFSFFGDAYLCERTRQGSVPPSGGGGGAGGSVPGSGGAPEDDEALRVTLLCDGAHKLVLRAGGNVMSTDAFSFPSACQAAVKQFRANAGCFCDARHAIVCLERGAVLTRVGTEFSFPSACDQALKSMERSVEIRFRAPRPAGSAN